MKKAYIKQDADAQMPENDFIHITYMEKSRHILGTQAVTSEEMGELMEKIHAGIIKGKPVYAYVHSGSRISTSPFSCPWDSGLSGVVYIDEGKEGDFGDIDDALESMVKEFNDYLSGNVWGYEICEVSPLGEETHIYSCCGYFGDITECGILDDIKSEGGEDIEIITPN